MPGEGWTYRIMLALSGISLILVIVYLIQSEQNRALRNAVEERQQFINQTLPIARVNEALIRALASAAVHDKDDKLRQLLAQNGITINPETGAPSAGGGAAAGPSPAGASGTAAGAKK